jgi:phosphotransferase system enzyme I (PtsI)
VEVGANIGDADSAGEAVRYGAEGVGLLRTEFLYLQNTRPPDEEQQIKAYKSVFDAMGDRPVIVRTLDIGGDKPPAYLKFDAELNPFLGWRAIRICLDDHPLFKTQLRAILRAAVGHRALIMYPMISSLDELRAANAVLAEVRAELDAAGLDYAREVPVGIMVETPAAAMLTDFLALECDFFSLGTNDLTQYTLAVDRTNERVAKLFQPLHPSVLRLIKRTIDAAHQHDKWVGMCGELAGMQKAIPILLGLGLDEFSMAPRSIPEAKWLIGQFTDARAREIAEQSLNQATAAEIEDFMVDVLEDVKA